MSKIMLVEDDNSLREIYEARLAAEGYTVVSAKDGEEALALALKERPDLIIADIMMPKVSGFDMLDILRSTPETKDTKIIMMTALSQAEDKARAESLGADKYLVKSQVTLEDVTREAKDMLATIAKDSEQAVSGMIGDNNKPAEQAAPPQPTTATTDQTVPQSGTTAATNSPTEPTATTDQPTDDTTSTQPAPDPTADAPVVPSANPIPVTTPPEDEETKSETTTPAPPEPAKSEPTATPIPVTEAAGTEEKPQSANVEPLEKEAKDLSAPVSEEKEEMDEQMDEFIASNPTLSSSPDTDTSDASEDEGTQQPVVADDTTDDINTAPETQEKENDADIDKNDQRQTYVTDDSKDNKPNASLEHTKRIEPIPGSGEEKPKLEDLLAKETDDTNTAPPPVSSVITPEQPTDS